MTTPASYWLLIYLLQWSSTYSTFPDLDTCENAGKEATTGTALKYTCVPFPPPAEKKERPVDHKH